MEMGKETLETLEKKILDSPNIPDDKKKEYLELLRRLQSEIEEAKNIDREKAASVSGFAKLSAYESTKKDYNPGLAKLAIEGLAESVKEFEAAYPRLADTVNRICHLLSNLGI